MLGLDVDCDGELEITVPRTAAHRRGARVRSIQVDEVSGLRVTCALQTLIDLAAALTDDQREWALESALRWRVVTTAELQLALPELSRRRTPGVGHIRRVLALRPVGARPTESRLESIFIQVCRRGGLPDPQRQVVVRLADGTFVARVDAAWLNAGLFVEIDGRQHDGQAPYDATRQTAVVAATRWLCARFTWDDVVLHPQATIRRLRQLVVPAAA